MLNKHQEEEEEERLSDYQEQAQNILNQNSLAGEPHQVNVLNNRQSSSYSSSASLSPSESAFLETALFETTNNKNSSSNANFIKQQDKNLITNLTGTKKYNQVKKVVKRHQHRLKNTNKDTNNPNTAINNKEMCCNRKCGCLFIISCYLSMDIIVNLFFVTKSFTKKPEGFQSFRIDTSLIDVWLISLIRDFFLLFVLIFFISRQQLIYPFVKFVHKKYISSFLCLIMYSYAMIKMLLHADQRKEIDRSSMLMYMWNTCAAFVFFLSWYMLALLKLKDCNYQKTDVDGGDMGENAGGDEDIFIETLKQTKKKRSSLFRLFKYSGPDLLFILMGTFFLIIGAICEAFVPYYTGQVLDSIIVKNNFDNFKQNAIFFISAHFLSGMFGGLRTCMFSIAVARLNVRLRKFVFRALIEQDIGFFDKVKTGDMLSRLSADTTTMSDLISQNLNGFLWNLVKTIGTLVFIMKLSWQLSLTCIIGAPIVFSMGKLFGNYYKKLSSKVQTSMAEANHVAEEALSTIRTVRSFANEDGEMHSYGSKLKNVLKYKVRQGFVFLFYDWSVKICELCMTVSMLTFGAHLVTTNQLTSGDFISFVIYQLTLATCLEGLTSVYTGLMSAAGASERIFEYLDIKPTLQITRAYEPDSIQGAIEFKNVHFTYPTRLDMPILKGISFSIRPGEVVALVGPSGSGKSSCVGLLERFYKPDKGEILIDGIPIGDYNHKYIHKVIALVGQEPVLYARNIKENIAYGLEDELEEEQIINAAKMANAHNFIMETTHQYDTECGERGTQLSGGQKQRIAIARALIRSPRVLLLDEATSALDAESEYLVQQAIHKNLKGHTVLLIAHRLSTVENADKIIVLDHGQIVEFGNHKELLKQNGLYAFLVQKQMHADNNDNESVISRSGCSTPSLVKTTTNNKQMRYSLDASNVNV